MNAAKKSWPTLALHGPCKHARMMAKGIGFHKNAGPTWTRGKGWTSLPLCLSGRPSNLPAMIAFGHAMAHKIVYIYIILNIYRICKANRVYSVQGPNVLNPSAPLKSTNQRHQPSQHTGTAGKGHWLWPGKFQQTIWRNFRLAHQQDASLHPSIHPAVLAPFYRTTPLDMRHAGRHSARMISKGSTTTGFLSLGLGHGNPCFSNSTSRLPDLPNFAIPGVRTVGAGELQWDGVHQLWCRLGVWWEGPGRAEYRILPTCWVLWWKTCATMGNPTNITDFRHGCKNFSTGPVDSSLAMTLIPIANFSGPQHIPERRFHLHPVCSAPGRENSEEAQLTYIWIANTHSTFNFAYSHNLQLYDICHTWCVIFSYFYIFMYLLLGFTLGIFHTFHRLWNDVGCWNQK